MTKQLWFRSIGMIGVAALSLAAPNAGAAPTAIPGTVNYIEGNVAINGRAVNTQQTGSTAIQANQVLSVDRGKAEVLLSPGVFLRVGNNSEVRMVSPGLADPQVELVRGEAMVEVDQKLKQAGLDVFERGADVALLKEGLYKFDADEAKVEVIDGKASVNENGQSKEIGKGKEIALTGGTLKAESFDRKAEDELYRWSDVRSGYLAQASEASARTVFVNGGWGSGWFWNPYFSSFAWLPGDGYFFSPFGYPFFSPRYVVYAPRIRAGYYGGGRAVTAGRAGTVTAFRAAPSFHAMARRR